MKSPLPYTIKGTVIDGEKIGRQLGIPSAKLDVVPPNNTIVPGVYAGTSKLDNKIHKSLIYFGPRLIFDEERNVLEVYLYNFDKDIYGKNLTVTFKYFIRNPQPFETFDELKQQMEQDKKEGKTLLKQSK